MRLQKLSTQSNCNYCHLVTHQTELFTKLVAVIIFGGKKLMSGNCNPCKLPAHLKGTSWSHLNQYLACGVATPHTGPCTGMEGTATEQSARAASLHMNKFAHSYGRQENGHWKEDRCEVAKMELKDPKHVVKGPPQRRETVLFVWFMSFDRFPCDPMFSLQVN